MPHAVPDVWRGISSVVLWGRFATGLEKASERENQTAAGQPDPRAKALRERRRATREHRLPMLGRLWRETLDRLATEKQKPEA